MKNKIKVPSVKQRMAEIENINKALNALSSIDDMVTIDPGMSFTSKIREAYGKLVLESKTK